MRLVIVEDDPILLESLKLLLSGEAGLTVAGAFGNAEDALRSLKKAAPEVMLADLGLPGMSGIELIKKAKEEMPQLEIMAHTVFEDRENVFSAIKAGASGYILKGSSPREIVEAIHEINKGGAPMSPKIARKVIHEFQDETVEEAVCPEPAGKGHRQVHRAGPDLQGDLDTARHQLPYRSYPYQEHL